MSAPAGSEAGFTLEKRFKGSIALFGPGLIGGSIALALRSSSPETSVTIWGRNPSQLEEITRRGLADAVHTDPVAAVQNADLIILCTPVGVMTELAKMIAPHLKPHALVTDAGSVKACVVEKLTPILGARFIGGHPMAGSERSGLAAARANLFEGAPCILTPLPTTPVPTLDAVRHFWESLGAQVTTMSPEAHDRLVARISHLPHAIAFALVNLVASTLLAGGSFRDGTRVAASDPDLWTGILSENRVEVVAALREMSGLLDSLAGNLEKHDSAEILAFLKSAREHRSNLPLPHPDEIL